MLTSELRSLRCAHDCAFKVTANKCSFYGQATTATSIPHPKGWLHEVARHWIPPVVYSHSLERIGRSDVVEYPNEGTWSGLDRAFQIRGLRWTMKGIAFYEL